MFKKKEDKKEKAFLTLLRKAYALMKQKNFSEAVSLYNQIDSKYKALPLRSKTEKIRQDIKTLHNELFLYLRINEAYVYSEEGNLDMLRKELDLIHSSLYDLDPTEETQPLIDYVSDHYKFFLEVYSYNFSQEEFNKSYKKVENLVHDNKISEAKKEYSQLIIIFQTLSRYIDEDEQEKLYAKLKELFKEISLRTLLKKAKRNPNPITPRKEVLTKVETPPRVLKPKSSLSHEFKDEYQELHRLLKSGDVDAAEKMYKKM